MGNSCINNVVCLFYFDVDFLKRGRKLYKHANVCPLVLEMISSTKTRFKTILLPLTLSTVLLKKPLI